MKNSPFCSFTLAGVSLTDYGLLIPSPFSRLTLNNSEIQSMTSWVLTCTVGGDESKRVNVAAFEALLYSSAQAASAYPDSSGIPVSFIFGWMDAAGNVTSYTSYQGFTIKFKVSTNGLYMTYNIEGFASLSVQTSMPVLRVPAVQGFVQPSAVLEALAIATKATSYYQLDIDHNDAPTYISHSPLTTSFNKYVRGQYSYQDEYDEFPGLLPLSKSYSASRDSGKLSNSVRKLSQAMNNRIVSPMSKFVSISNTDTAPQIASFAYWVTEPTMNRPGTIHYKSQAGLISTISGAVLEYGTANTNILSLQGSYDGVAYNMSNMRFSQVGFSVDGSGNTIAEFGQVVNSWSSSLASVYQSANIINDINALASQFSGDFTIEIPGTVESYNVAQPVSLVVLTGNTLSPITGVYNIISVGQEISNTFITRLKIQRLVISSANQVAASQGILIGGNAQIPGNAYSTTSNIITPYKVRFPEIYPSFENLTYSV